MPTAGKFDVLERRLVIYKVRIGRREIKAVTPRIVSSGTVRLEQENDIAGVPRDVLLDVTKMDDAVADHKMDRVVFEVDAAAFFLDELQVGKVRTAVLVETHPDFGTVNIGRIYADIAAELPGVQVFDLSSPDPRRGRKKASHRLLCC